MAIAPSATSGGVLDGHESDPRVPDTSSASPFGFRTVTPLTGRRRRRPTNHMTRRTEMTADLREREGTDTPSELSGIVLVLAFLAVLAVLAMLTV